MAPTVYSTPKTKIGYTSKTDQTIFLLNFRAKRFYTKISYTSKYDWPIRHLLDDAEDHIANDAQAAIDKLNAILKKYPDSPRAQYDLIRAIQYRFYERERDEKISEEQKTEHTLDLIQKFVEIITQYR